MGDRFGPVPIPSGAAVSTEVNHLKGKKVDVLTNPGTRMIYLECERGDYRIRSGDIADGDMPDDAIPRGDVSDGSGSLSLQDGQIRIIPAPEKLTVRGLSNRSVLTYYYV